MSFQTIYSINYLYLICLSTVYFRGYIAFVCLSTAFISGYLISLCIKYSRLRGFWLSSCYFMTVCLSTISSYFLARFRLSSVVSVFLTGTHIRCYVLPNASSEEVINTNLHARKLLTYAYISKIMSQNRI